MHLLAYNLIRGVMAQAADAHEKRPRQLSFKGTLQTITAFQEAMRRAAPADREFLMQAMLARSHSTKSVIDLVERNLAPINAVPRQGRIVTTE